MTQLAILTYVGVGKAFESTAAHVPRPGGSPERAVTGGRTNRRNAYQIMLHIQLPRTSQ
jgi:hypothetical protein